MSNQETVTSPAELSPEQFQHVTDTYFGSKAPYLLPHDLGVHFLSTTSLEDRRENDLTLVTTTLVRPEMATTPTDVAVQKFKDGIPNVDRLSAELFERINSEEFKDDDTIVIVAPHTQLFDIQGLIYLAQSSEENPRDPQDNILFLGRLLPYGDYSFIPNGRFGNFMKKVHIPNILGISDETYNIGTDLVLPTTTVVLVYPQSEGMEDFHKLFGENAANANLKSLFAAMNAVREKRKEPPADGAKTLIFIAPTASRMKEGKLQAVQPEALSMINYFVKKGIPVLPAGFDVDMVRNFFLSRFKLWSQKDARMVLGDTIGRNKEEIGNEEIHHVLAQIAREVMRNSGITINGHNVPDLGKFKK